MLSFSARAVCVSPIARLRSLIRVPTIVLAIR